MAMTLIERRASPRVDVNGEITYRTGDSGEFRSGEIENLSVGGALVWIEQDLPNDCRLLLRTVPKNDEETVFQFEAIVLHKLPAKKDSLHGYRCQFADD